MSFKFIKLSARYWATKVIMAPIKKQKDLGEETEAPKPNAKDPGATLGAGPSASSKGVKNNAYVKQFGYKVVK